MGIEYTDRDPNYSLRQEKSRMQQEVWDMHARMHEIKKEMRRKERNSGVVRGEGDGEDCEEQERPEGTEDVGGAGGVEDWVDGVEGGPEVEELVEAEMQKD
jgi:hypothetical protein